MIYRLPPHLRLWDTWMLREGKNYHLFTLTQPIELGYWDRVCHAVSTDLINWEDCEDIILEEKEDKGKWDAGVILTGSVFRCARGYGMTYGAVRHGDRVQKIGMAFSKDLHRWEKYSANPILVPKGPFYEDDPETTTTTTESSIAWRDAYVIPIENGYEAFIAANDATKTKTVNGCVARVFSRDLIHWEYFPPIASPGKYVDMEVPQYFELNGYHYLLFSTGGPVDIPSRVRSGGTYYLVSESKYGDYRIPEDNLLIGSGEGRFDCYVGKVISTDNGFLLYHHITVERTSFAAPKVLRQDKQGKLWLERWEGLDKLKGRVVISATTSGSVVNAYNHIPIGTWRNDDKRLIGDAGSAISGWLFDEMVKDCAIQVEVYLREACCAGVLLRIAPAQETGLNREPKIVTTKGLALCLNRSRGVIQLCEAQIESRRSIMLKPLDNVYVGVGERSKVEIFLREEYVEIYCDSRPLFVLNASDYPISGKVGLFVQKGKAIFEGLEVREIPVGLR